MDSETCVIVMDFIENCSFLVQDAIQRAIGRISKPHSIPFQYTTMMMMVDLNVTVIVSY